MVLDGQLAQLFIFTSLAEPFAPQLARKAESLEI